MPRANGTSRPHRVRTSGSHETEARNEINELHRRRFEVAYHPPAWGGLFVSPGRAPQALIYVGACLLGLLLIALIAGMVRSGPGAAANVLLVMGILLVAGVLMIGLMVLVYLALTSGLQLLLSLPARLASRPRKR